MQEYDTNTAINAIHNIVLGTWGEAVSVNIFVNEQSICVEPAYKSKASGFSMKRINGEWIDRR